MEDFFVQECCVHGTDLENHGPTSILCDDPLPIESNAHPGHLSHLGPSGGDFKASWRNCISRGDGAGWILSVLI